MPLPPFPDTPEVAARKKKRRETMSAKPASMHLERLPPLGVAGSDVFPSGAAARWLFPGGSPAQSPAAQPSDAILGPPRALTRAETGPTTVLPFQQTLPRTRSYHANLAAPPPQIPPVTWNAGGGEAEWVPGQENKRWQFAATPPAAVVPPVLRMPLPPDYGYTAHQGNPWGVSVAPAEHERIAAQFWGPQEPPQTRPNPMLMPQAILPPQAAGAAPGPSAAELAWQDRTQGQPLALMPLNRLPFTPRAPAAPDETIANILGAQKPAFGYEPHPEYSDPQQYLRAMRQVAAGEGPAPGPWVGPASGTGRESQTWQPGQPLPWRRPTGDTARQAKRQEDRSKELAQRSLGLRARKAGTLPHEQLFIEKLAAGKAPEEHEKQLFIPGYMAGQAQATQLAAAERIQKSQQLARVLAANDEAISRATSPGQIDTLKNSRAEAIKMLSEGGQAAPEAPASTSPTFADIVNPTTNKQFEKREQAAFAIRGKGTPEEQKQLLDAYYGPEKQGYFSPELAATAPMVLPWKLYPFAWQLAKEQLGIGKPEEWPVEKREQERKKQRRESELGRVKARD
jgi:hypothetical protein